MAKPLFKQCCENVWRKGQWTPSRCSRTGTVEREGRFYCQQHDPVARSERFDKSYAEYQQRNAEAAARARLERAAPDLLAALKAVVSVADRRTVEFDAARAAIARAEGRSE